MLVTEKVWSLDMDKLVTDILSNCLGCAATTPRYSQEPLHMSPMPDLPWQQLLLAFYGPIHTGEISMVLLDDFSRYPIVNVVKSTPADNVIPVFD